MNMSTNERYQRRERSVLFCYCFILRPIDQSADLLIFSTMNIPLEAMMDSG